MATTVSAGEIVSTLRKQRRAHHKVKTGCKACKLRRQKCDEGKPACAGCLRHSTPCHYQHLSAKSSLSERRPKSNAGLVPTESSSGSLSNTSPAVLNLDDLELMHQYLTCTCIATGQLPEVTARIQLNVPRLAQSYPFVMQGILAMAATHLSRLRPTREAHYAMLAARKHEIAIPDFRFNLQAIDRRNCHALISFAKGLLWCSFARHEMIEEQDSAFHQNGDWLPEWFRLLHGSCLIVNQCRPWILDGPVAHTQPLLVYPVEECDSNEDLDTRQIADLMLSLQSVTGSDLCKQVLSTLRAAFHRASLTHQNTPLRNAINLWIGSLPEAYIELLKREEPWTLVVLAYFCVLIKRSETVWFMQGRALGLMRSIKWRLDHDFKQFIKWPCEQIGVDPD